jgi:hypothetical protein
MKGMNDIAVLLASSLDCADWMVWNPPIGVSFAFMVVVQCESE